MKGYLLDENLPQRILFKPKLPLVSYARLGTSASDAALWDYAAVQELVIISKDADFSNRCLVSEPPPWVVHLRFGNMRRQAFHALLARVWQQIEDLLPEHKLINVFSDRIEAIR